MGVYIGRTETPPHTRIVDVFRRGDLLVARLTPNKAPSPLPPSVAIWGKGMGDGGVHRAGRSTAPTHSWCAYGQPLVVSTPPALVQVLVPLSVPNRESP
jgi:hypothetical protein